MRPNTFIYKIYFIYYLLFLHQFYSEQSHMMNDQKTNSFEVHREEKSTISPLFTATNKHNK